MKIREITNQEYKNFINNFNLKSVYQSIEYGYIMKNHGFNNMLIGLERDGVIIAASLILIQKKGAFKYAYAPRGILLNYNNFELLKEFTLHLKGYLNKIGIIAIKINPLISRKVYDFKNQKSFENPNYDIIFDSLQRNGYYHLGYNNFFEALKPRFEAYIDLSKNESDLFNGIKKSYRTKIKSAIRNGISVITAEADQLTILSDFTKDKYIRNLNYFKDCYGYFRNSNNVDYLLTKLDTNTYLREIQKKLHNYEQLSNNLNTKIININIKRKEHLINKKINIDKYVEQYRKDLVFATNLLKHNQDGIITSAALVIRHENEATILVDGYDANYKKLNSKHMLIWQLIQTYKKLGFTKLNLGGMSNIIKDNNKYTGLDKFKLGFNSIMVEYAGDFELVVNKTNYTLYRNFLPIKNLIKK